MVSKIKHPSDNGDIEHLSASEILDKHFERKKPNKKAKEKLIKQVIKEVKEKEKPVKEIVEPNNRPKIEFVIEETSYFKINWFYIKTIFVNAKNFIFHPIKFFKNPSAHKIPTAQLIKDENESLYEDIKKMDDKVKRDMFEIVRSDK